MKKRVLIITNRLVIGGPAIHIAMLAENLQNEFEILLLGGQGAKGEITNLDLFKNIDNEPLIIEELSKSINPFQDFVAYKKIKKTIKSYKPDIVHTHTAKPGLLARLAVKKSDNIKMIHTFHGHLFRGYFNPIISFFLVRLERFLAKKTDVIISLSKNQQHDILNKYKIGKKEQHKIIPLAVNDQFLTSNIDENRKKFREEYKISDDEIVVGIIGRLSKIKNIKLFIEMLSRVKIKTSKKVRAFIIGDGPEKQDLKHLAIKEGIDYAEYTYGKRKADLIFTSWCSNISKAVAGIDILALTSKSEGTPMSIIESQMCSKPVVSFDIGGVKDIVIPDKTAFIIPNKDEESFVKKLLQLIENKELRNKMGEEAKDFAFKNFTSDLFIKNYTKLYKDL